MTSPYARLLAGQATDHPTARQTYFNLIGTMATKFFARKKLEEKMEAEGRRFLKMKDERDFFALIEKRLEQHGFEVIETLPPDRKNRRKFPATLHHRPISHTVY